MNLKSVELPSAIYDASASGAHSAQPYQVTVNRVTATDVAQLLVLVDTARGAVVNITPGPESQVVSTPETDIRQSTSPAGNE